MTTNRREFLKFGAGAGAVMMTSGAGFAAGKYLDKFNYLQPGAWQSYQEFEATPEQAKGTMDSRGVVTRKHIGDLSADELERFKRAVGVMRGRSERDPMHPQGWNSQALQHALYCSSAQRNLQVHWSWFFLPWHRGYLWSVEQMLAAATGDKDFALPYWDWTRNPYIDPAYIGFGNPLHDNTRIYTGSDQIPLDFMDVEAALAAPDFNQFGGHPYPLGQGELIEGVMEQSFHNNVHNWIGGNMAAFPTAAFDPIFTGHHGNIDRAWSAWAAMSGHEMPDDEDWLNTFFTYPTWDGGLTQISIKDMLNTEDMGYKFHDLDFRQPDIQPPKLGTEATLFGVKASTSDRARIANTMKSGRRYGMLQFDRVNVPMHPLCVRAFIGAPGEAPHYISTVTFLPIQTGGIGALNSFVSMQVSLPAELHQLISSNKALEVHLDPVQLRGRDIPKDPIRLDNITLTAA